MSIAPPPSRPLVRFVGFAAAGVVLFAARAGAAETCRVEIAGSGAEAWREAVRALEATLAEGQRLTDCARVVLRVEGKRGHLTFTTTDGRSAERDVADPSELAATVAALGTMDPRGSRSEAPASRSTETIVEPARASEAERPAAELGEPKPGRARIVYGALAGARVGAGGLATPIVDAFAAIDLDHWQIGVLGRAEPRYVNLADGRAQPRTGALGAGVMVGRREPLGRHLLVVTGATVVVSAVHEDRSDKSTANTTHADGRLGGYVGVVAARRSSARFRADLMADVMPPRAPERSEEGVTLTPWWGVALMAGVELGGP